MRIHWHGSALSLALVLGACSTHEQQTSALSDDLKKDLAIASSPSSGDLATAPQRYQRMRFVSGVEQFPGVAPARGPNVSRRVTHAKPSHHARLARAVATTGPVAEMPASSPEPAPTAVAEKAEPTVSVENPTPTPVSAPGGRGDGSGDHDSGPGWGRILGGIIGGVVIRGGSGGVDHCDPRTDGRVGRPAQIPVLGLPLPSGGGVFGRGGRGGGF